MRNKQKLVFKLGSRKKASSGDPTILPMALSRINWKIYFPKLSYFGNSRENAIYTSVLRAFLPLCITFLLIFLMFLWDCLQWPWAQFKIQGSCSHKIWRPIWKYHRSFIIILPGSSSSLFNWLYLAMLSRTIVGTFFLKTADYKGLDWVQIVWPFK